MILKKIIRYCITITLILLFNNANVFAGFTFNDYFDNNKYKNLYHDLHNLFLSVEEAAQINLISWPSVYSSGTFQKVKEYGTFLILDRKSASICFYTTKIQRVFGIAVGIETSFNRYQNFEKLKNPRDMRVDSSGNVFISDSTKHAINKYKIWIDESGTKLNLISSIGGFGSDDIAPVFIHA